MRFVGSGIAASAVGHLAILATILLFAEVHPFGQVTAETVKVDIVTPEEALASEKTSGTTEPAPTPGELPLPELKPSSDSATAAPAASTPPAATPETPQPVQSPQPAKASPPAKTSPPAKSSQSVASATPAQVAPSAPPPEPARVATQQPFPAAIPPAIPQEPDITVKYNVMLGLPPEKPGDGFDALASDKADLSSQVVEEFRRHLRTCAKLPPSIAASDNVWITLRIFMTPDGRLAADPRPVAGSPSAKGPALSESAISAIRDCQPFAMLPRDKYDEWKMLDLRLTPRDFAGG